MFTNRPRPIALADPTMTEDQAVQQNQGLRNAIDQTLSPSDIAKGWPEYWALLQAHGVGRVTASPTDPGLMPDAGEGIASDPNSSFNTQEGPFGPLGFSLQGLRKAVGR